MAAGEEIIGWVSREHVTESEPFVEEHDYWMATADPAHVTPVRLSAGQLAILYPVDLHAPRRAANGPVPVNKVVVKVAVQG